MADDTLVDKMLFRLKNNRFLSYLIIGAVIFLALVSFAKGVQEAGAIYGKAVASSTSTSQYDAETKKALIAVARKVDYFFLKIESLEKPPTFRDESIDFIDIKADLRSLLLRNQIRPLNEISTQQTVLLLEQWSFVEELLKTPTGANPAAMSVAREIMFAAFNATIKVEESKIRNEN